MVNMTKRKFNSAWPSAQADPPERKQAVMAATRQRRNQMAHEMGYRNAGGLLAAIERAAPKV